MKSVRQGNLMNRFKEKIDNEKGLFDIASIMVGIVIVGIMAALITITLVVAIPWFQNREANDNLSIILTAENSARADYSEYVDYPELLESNYITAEKLRTPACVTLNAGKDEFTAFVKSETGELFKYESTTGEITPTTEPATCTLI